jgi:hypothetical protein
MTAIAKVEGREREAEGGKPSPDAGRFQIDGKRCQPVGQSRQPPGQIGIRKKPVNNMLPRAELFLWNELYRKPNFDFG